MECNFLKKLIILTTIIEISKCNSDSEPSDATSRIRFIQFQPLNDEKQSESSTEGHTTDDQESKQSNIFPKTAEELGVSHSDSLVPKNYAFAYAIKDQNTGDDFSHTQAHNGKATRGQYRVKLPDGRVQVVTYLADNGGYRADIRYDQNKNAIFGIQEEADNSGAYNLYSKERLSASTIKEDNSAISPKSLSKKNDSPLVYYDEVRNFGVSTTSKTPASSYETVEHVDEEDKYPYDRKLIDDVNYLLRFVTPTMKTEPDNYLDEEKSKYYEPLYKLPTLENDKNTNERFKLPQDFPYRSTQLKNNGRLTQKFAFSPISSTVSSPPFETSERTAYSSTPKYNSYAKLQKSKPLFLPNIRNQEPLYASTPRGDAPGQQSLSNQNVFTPSSTPAYEAPSQLRYKSPISSSTPKYESLSSTPRELQNIYTETHPLQPQNFIIPDERKENQDSYISSTPRHNPTDSQSHYTPESLSSTPSLSPLFRSQESVSEAPKPNKIFRPSQPLISRYQVNSQPLLFASHNEQLKQSHENLDVNSYVRLKDPKYQQYEVTQYDGPYNPDFFPENRGPKLFSPNVNENSQESPPVAPVPSFDSKEHPPVSAGPSYNSEELPPVLPVDSRYKSEDYNSDTPPLSLFRPTLPSTDSQKTSPEEGKIEIPQYLHIHKYEPGVDGKPKELIYYTPLRIQVPSSVAYMEHGSANISSQGPAYVSMTEHPQNSHAPQSGFPPSLIHYQDLSEHSEAPVNLSNIKTDISDSSGKPKSPSYQSIDNSKYVSSTPTFKESHYFNESPHNKVQPHSVIETTAEEHDHDLSAYFDPRTYSGYFDFLSSSEMEEDKHVEDNQSDRDDDTRPKSSPLPQFVYNYATATPSHRYISSELSSREILNSMQDDPIRNSTFRSSAYLRPLHKERVYIHHNSQPTTPAYDDQYNSIASTSRPIHKNTDFSIVKSISSIIPAELLKDFDDQLSSSILQDNSNEGTEVKTKVTVPEVTINKQKLNKSVVKKLQSTLTTNGKMNLKVPLQERNVR